MYLRKEGAFAINDNSICYSSLNLANSIPTGAHAIHATIPKMPWAFIRWLLLGSTGFTITNLSNLMPELEDTLSDT